MGSFTVIFGKHREKRLNFRQIKPFLDLWGGKGVRPKFVLRIMIQQVKVYLFCNKKLTIRVILGHLKPK